LTPERFREVRKLFDAVVQLTPDAREPLLQQAGRSDPDLVRGVRRLLAAENAALAGIEADISASLHVRPGADIGPYRLLCRIGEGGMGEVWLAAQQAPLQRRVALKMIKAGMDTRRVIARFEAERQALAQLEHPAVARVIDAGTTAVGRPYFVMEFVDGRPIDEFCDRERLPVTERLRLFSRVCDGVQHAHNRAIIHRDLKPSNILVSHTEGGLQPKIIDFGIAKALAGTEAGPSGLTKIDQPVGTPEYMSPEQRAQGELVVDTRTDVYALGVMLYELLAGSTPTVPHAAGERDAPRPSTALGRSVDATRIAGARGSDPGRLASMLRGDLDWIVLKAMAPDRDRRYGSPAELAADLQRYLGNRPVTARPPTAAYLASRFVQRHRIGVSMAMLLACALLVGIAGMGFAWQRALQAEEIARREAATATEALDFIVTLFKGADPMAGGSASATALDIVEDGARRIAATEFSDPLVEARLSQVVGDVLTELAAFDRGLEWLERAHAIQVQLLGPEHDISLRTAQRKAFVYWARGPVTEAARIQRVVLEVRQRKFGAMHPATIDAGRELISILLRLEEREEAQTLVEDFVERSLTLYGIEHPTTLDLLMLHGSVLTRMGHMAEAESIYRQVLSVRRSVLGPTHLSTRAAEFSLAAVLVRTGRYEAAEVLLDELREQVGEQFGSRHKAVFRVMAMYGELRRGQGRWAEAADLQRQALAGFMELLEPGHPDVVGAQRALAATLELKGLPLEREPLLAER
jgi:eukaryotic-like serine/threonine-protein kinase